MSRCRVALVLAILSVSPASAQDLSGYLTASLFVSPWSPQDVSGSPSLSYDNEGRTNRFLPGATIEAGVHLGPRIGVGVEVALAPRRAIDQTHFYFNPFMKEARYRDTTIFVVARLRVGSDRAGVDLVGGGGLVRQSSLERTAPGRFGVDGYTFGALGPEVEVSRWGRGGMGGIDFSTQVSPRVSIGPQFRVVYADRGDIATVPEFQSFGIPKVTYRIGLAIRAQF
ncbi:MAG: hypothetical protein AB7H93_15660 [Vicinamibacterales bacterium]